ncbi:hypothetical protein TNCV_3689111 [Trichonephila clavipes]|uniref:Uncharacterized protein n=1 Tax=Trichonephila clavipes TaxID=2585209 RepID=A0A8X6VPY6_TRICX|nr:hypothetical protein TNCV_3689111 [Trichonephila clavipes]
MSFSQALCDGSRRHRGCSESAVRVWTVAIKAVGSTRACHMMWRSSGRLICRGRPELVTVSMMYLLSTGPNTSSQSNHNVLLDELTTQLPSC